MSPDSMELGERAPKAIVFDIDGTLSDLREKPTRETLEILAALLQGKAPVAFATGASMRRMKEDYLEPLKAYIRPDNCFVFVDNGAEMHTFDGNSWRMEYQEKFADEQVVEINDAILSTIQKSPFSDKFVNRETSVRASKIVFHAIPADTPDEEKDAWCGDNSAILTLKSDLGKMLPYVNIHVDDALKPTVLIFTLKGFDKAHAIRKLSERLGVPPETMLFIGDGFAEGGNDRQALPSGVKALRTGNPHHTRRIIKKMRDAGLI